MKNLSWIFLALVITSCNNEEKPAFSIINGTVVNNVGETALILGNGFESRVPISDEGTFVDTLYLKTDGFYDLYVGRERTGIYLEKGKNLIINVDAEKFDETIKYTGDLANINNFLGAKSLWNEENMDFENLFSKDESSFLQQLDYNQKSHNELYAEHKIDNEQFKKKLDEDDRYARALMIENYKDAYRYYSGDDTFNVSKGFYDELKDINYKDTVAYRSSVTYQNLLQAHFNRLISAEKSDSLNNNGTIAYLEKVDSALPDGYAKDKMMSSFLQFGLKPDESLEQAFNLYKNSNPNPDNLAKITAQYDKLKAITKGNPSPTFNYENHKGGTTSLESLKGKYVYIDVWATWCGPCLREIPSLKEVDKDYSNKNIQFVSISIDEPKDYEKWKAMVTDKQLVGLQLMADNNWKSKFVEDYAILGIPRFILIDPQGNIVTADAPRPSDPELRKTLDRLL